MCIVPAFDDGQIAFEGKVRLPGFLGREVKPALLVCHIRKFSHSHSMGNRYRKPAHSALELTVQHRTVCEESYRVRSVEDDKRNVELGTLAHHLYHGNIICVESDSHILKVKQHHVKAFHHLLVCHLGAVEGTDRYPCPYIHAGGNMFACICRSPESVFRAHQANDIDALGKKSVQNVGIEVQRHIFHSIHSIAEKEFRRDFLALLEHYAGLVGKKAHSLSFKQGKIFVQRCSTWLDVSIIAP